MAYLLHAANVLYLLSYLVKDIPLASAIRN